MNAFNPGNQDFISWANKNAKEYVEPSTIGENFAVGVGEAIDETLSISSLLNTEYMDERQAQVKALIAEGTISPEELELFKTKVPGRSTNSSKGYKYNYNDIANYANENLDLPKHINNDLEVAEERNKMLASRRTYREEIRSRATTGGKFADFGGMMTGIMLDPVNAVTLPLAAPLTGIKAASKGLYALSVAKRTAALNMGIAVAVEPFIHSWKEEIGAEYSIEDSMFNVGAAGVFGGTVGGLSGYIGAKYMGGTTLSKDRASLVQMFRKEGLDEEEAHGLANLIADANEAPDPNMTVEDFVTKREQAGAELEKGPVRNDIESDLDINQEAHIDELFEAMDTELVTFDIDGVQRTFKEMDDMYKADKELFKSKLECLHGG